MLGTATRPGIGDYIADQYFAGEKAAAEHDLAAPHTIARSKLDETDQLAYDTFEWQTKDTLRGLQPDILQLTEVQPINHFFGLHTFYPTFASGQGAAPFKTLEDYENNLKRHREFATYLDRAGGRFRHGERVFRPRPLSNPRRCHLIHLLRPLPT